MKRAFRGTQEACRSARSPSRHLVGRVDPNELHILLAVIEDVRVLNDEGLTLYPSSIVREVIDQACYTFGWVLTQYRPARQGCSWIGTGRCYSEK